MRTTLRRCLWVAAATAVLVALLASNALPASRAVAIWVVMLTAIALRELVRSLDRSDEPKSGFERVLLQRNVPAPETSVYAPMEREIDLATATADHAHRRLVPLLRAAAASRLAMRHGIDLERRPDRARELLDDQTWELVRPDRPVPPNRHAPGPRRDEIAAVVAQLEAL
ncbi:MAG: hypothetical protein QOG85_2182 [Gaiellaceae bacterium]|jgi:hypothetical protein|nr:hypothetical protein [Gaiellaceae bacterium]